LAGVAIWSRPLESSELSRTYAEQASGIDPVVIPVAPTELAASNPGSSQAALTWQDNSSNETGYVVERSADGVTFAPLAALDANSTSFIDAAPFAGTNYYRVAATNTFGFSDYSNIGWAGGGRPSSPGAIRVSGLLGNAGQPSQRRISR
jgi:titin